MKELFMKSAIVIGAGIGGIAVAGRLARAGYDVHVFEKASKPGGRTVVLEREGYRFDIGPTLFLMPEVWEKTYADLGERMADHLDLIRLDPTYRVHFHDGTHLDFSGNMHEMEARLEEMEPGAFEAYLKFISRGAMHYRVALEKFVGRNFYNILEFFSPANLPLLFKLKALTTHYNHVAGYFDDPRLRAAFTFQNVYLGMSPFEAPATYSLLQYTEAVRGVWFPRGGLYKAIESLTGIAEGLGVTFHYNAPVTRIDVNGSRAEGVTLEGGETVKADVVIANADLPYVYDQLLPDKGAAQSLMNKKFTSSALMFYWGVKGGKNDALLHHNLFLADHRYKESFDRIFHDYALPDDPSIYVNVPARTDPNFAPEDGEGLMVLVPVGPLSDDHHQDWDDMQARARAAAIGYLEGVGVANLKDRIVFEETITPENYRDDFNLARGAAFGLRHNFFQIGYMRPHNRHAQYKNLYFAGASTHPGTGLPIVLISAQLAAERIQKEIV
jgi:phytoene desaturase